MFGLFALLLSVSCFFATWAIYRWLGKRSTVGARVWAVFAAGMTLWYFFGYRLTSNYEQFKTLCETEAGPHILNPTPTRNPYVHFCSTAMRILPHSRYDAFECEDNRQWIRVRFIGHDLPQCKTPSQGADYPAECFEIEPIDRISTPYSWTFREPVATIDSRWSLGRLVITETKAASPSGTIIAYIRQYLYVPQRRAVRLIGIRVASPVIKCAREEQFPSIEDMFPPAAIGPHMSPMGAADGSRRGKGFRHMQEHNFWFQRTVTGQARSHKRHRPAAKPAHYASD